MPRIGGPYLNLFFKFIKKKTSRWLYKKVNPEIRCLNYTACTTVPPFNPEPATYKSSKSLLLFNHYRSALLLKGPHTTIFVIFVLFVCYVNGSFNVIVFFSFF
jgi:hypothetical protein